ncbi:MAG: branched-chain amino acid transport system substrate-binding protein [Actinomycetota bacterium]|jgi:branched-chain amino acid transport system substrate-binding protein|nr:branched-chain amino acid transport system substrate-binding protein [Actinomycetota bacterium]
MIRPTPIWRSLALLTVAGVVLTACGGSSGAGTTTQPSKSSSATSSAPAAAKGDGQLVVGTLLPQTGSLAFLGPPEFAGVDLALKDINDAGGVLGKPVKKFDSDSGDTSTDTASQSVDRLLSQKVDAIVGAASSSTTLTVIDKITGAGVLQISPANTSIELIDYPDHGLYFRTAPPDLLQGRIIGDLMAADGHSTAGILALQDSYGTGLAKTATAAFESSGGKVVQTVIYDPKAASFATEVSKIKAADPEAIVLISFDEVFKIIPELIKQGIGPQNKKIYLVDGDLKNFGTKDFPKGTFTGTKGTTPGVQSGDAFKNRLKSINPKLTDFNYGPEAYDATTLVALAATAAKNDSGAAIASKMQEVSAGGEKCKSYKDCLALLQAGKDIDYDGVSGPIEFNSKGDPSEATIGIYQYGADNLYKFIEEKSGKV